MTDLEKLQRFDAEMRKRFGLKWAPIQGDGNGTAGTEQPAGSTRGPGGTPAGPILGAGDGAKGAGRELPAKTAAGGSIPAGPGTAPAGTGGAAKAPPPRMTKAEAEYRVREVYGELQREEMAKRTNPNRIENEFMQNLMITRNALVAKSPAIMARAKRAGRNCWRDIRLLTTLVEKVQEELLATMPPARDEYYAMYAKHGHYELMMNGPVRGTRFVLISDRHLAAVCEAAMANECVMCMREGGEIGQCLLRKALMEVAPPTEIQDGRWRKCEYRDAAGQMINGEAIEI